MSLQEHPPSIAGAQYSSLFYSGLRAISASARFLSTPHISSRSPIRPTFWSYGYESDDEPEPSSRGSEFSFESNSTVTSVSEPEQVLMIKGVPLLFGMSRNLTSEISLVSSPRYKSLDPLAPSSSNNSSFSLDLSDFAEAASNADSLPTSPVDLTDDSFLSFTTSTQPSPLPTRRCSFASQNHITASSRRSSLFALIERAHHDINDEHWMYDFETDSPLDALPLSTIEVKSPVDTARWEHDDWRAFHADWIQDPHLTSWPSTEL